MFITSWLSYPHYLYFTPMKHQRAKSFKRHLLALGFGFSLLFIVALMLELVLRTWCFEFYHPSHFYIIDMTPWNKIRIAAFPSPVFNSVHPTQAKHYPFQADREFIWSLKSNFKLEGGINYGTPNADVFLNSQGWRSPEFLIDKRDGVFRIVCLGDSVTFGYGPSVGQEDPYPRKLENHLNHEFPHLDFEVINCGVPGYSSYQGLHVLKEIIAYQPDIVTIAYGHNDMYVRQASDKAQIQEFRKARYALTMLLNRFECYKMMKYMLLGAGKEFDEVIEDGQRRVSLDDFEYNIEMMLSLCRYNEIRPVLFNAVLEPKRRPAVTERLNKIGAENDAPLVVLKDILEDANQSILALEKYRLAATYFLTKNVDLACHYRVMMEEPVHPNALGHQVIADYLFEFLKKEGLLIKKMEMKEEGLPNEKPRLIHLNRD